jgi:hypothetical protein
VKKISSGKCCLERLQQQQFVVHIATQKSDRFEHAVHSQVKSGRGGLANGLLFPRLESGGQARNVVELAVAL